MHASSYRHMQQLVDQHLAGRAGLRIADLGSQDVNGSYRPLFERPGWQYVGIDLAAGNNVDIVLASAYRLPLATGSFDVVVSGQVFEHVEYFWLTWMEMARLLKPGGLILLIAPSRGPEHRYPVDCWRFYPDGYIALAKYAGLEVLQATTDWAPAPEDDSAPWGDSVGVFRKPANESIWQRARFALKCRIGYWLAA
jgi:SAM-dependent methyltransferase